MFTWYLHLVLSLSPVVRVLDRPYPLLYTGSCFWMWVCFFEIPINGVEMVSESFIPPNSTWSPSHCHFTRFRRVNMSFRYPLNHSRCQWERKLLFSSSLFLFSLSLSQTQHVQTSRERKDDRNIIKFLK